MTDHSTVRPAAPIACGKVSDEPAEDPSAALLAALELLLPYAVTAPPWAVEAARDAITKAKGETP
jgi:hypothetical protein